MNLPNKLTVLRVVAVPFFIILYLKEYVYLATVLFCIASATDAIDGYIARKRGMVTNFGKIMDPLADKILVISAFVILVQLDVVPGWMLIVILTREFVVAGLRTVAAADGIVISAGFSGKLKTVTQMIAVPLLLLKNWPFKYFNIPMDQWMLWICVILTVVSGIEYVFKNRGVFLKGGV